jgi:hypothetical protein
LTALTGPFDGYGPHSIGTIVGARGETIAIYPIANASGMSIGAL